MPIKINELPSAKIINNHLTALDIIVELLGKKKTMIVYVSQKIAFRMINIWVINTDFGKFFIYLLNFTLTVAFQLRSV